MMWKRRSGERRNKSSKRRARRERKARKLRGKRKTDRRPVATFTKNRGSIDSWFKRLKAIPTLKAAQQDDPNEERDVTLHPSWCRRSLLSFFLSFLPRSNRVNYESILSKRGGWLRTIILLLLLRADDDVSTFRTLATVVEEKD